MCDGGVGDRRQRNKINKNDIQERGSMQKEKKNGVEVWWWWWRAKERRSGGREIDWGWAVGCTREKHKRDTHTRTHKKKTKTPKIK